MKALKRLRPRVYRGKMKPKKTDKDWKARVIFRVPKEIQADFLSLKRVGYGDTEIVVECLLLALPAVKLNLLERRAQESREELEAIEKQKLASAQSAAAAEFTKKERVPSNRK